MIETNEAGQAQWHDVGEPDDFPNGAVWPVLADGLPVAVFRQGDDLFALHDLCTHGAAKLLDGYVEDGYVEDGYVEDGYVECPLHQGTFDIKTGAPCKAPVTEALRSFPVRIVAGRVEVGLT